MPVISPPPQWLVVLDPLAIATGRTELSLNTGAIRVDQKGIDWGDAAITAFMADLRIGSEAVDYRIPNRHPSIPVFLGADESGTEETVRSYLQQKIALFQREGGFLLRQRGNGPAMYADVVSATLTLPDVYGETGGIEQGVVVNLECLPDFYGDEVQLDTIAATGYFSQVLTSSGTQALISGDHPGRCRITVADTSGHSQLGLLWGFRSRYYDSASTAKLVYEAEAMTPQGSASIVTQAGASGGSVVRYASLPGSAWTSILTTDLPGIGSLTHRGTYRVFARCYSASARPQLRFQWSVGSLAVPITNTATVLQGSGNFYLVDLGDIRVVSTPTGSYAWTGAIQAQPSVAGDPIMIDQIFFQPLDDGAGRLLANTQVGSDVVIYQGGSAELRFDGMFRPNPASAAWGSVSTIVGDLVRIPPSGLEGRVCELFIKPTRGDITTLPDTGLDGMTVQAKYRPCYIGRP